MTYSELDQFDSISSQLQIANEESSQNLQSKLVQKKASSQKVVSESSGSLKFSIKGRKISRDLQRWNLSRQTLDNELEIERIDQELQEEIPNRSSYSVFSFAYLACLLCQRKFKNSAHLKCHMSDSALHRSNLNLDVGVRNRLIEESCIKCSIPLAPLDDLKPVQMDLSKNHTPRKRYDCKSDLLRLIFFSHFVDSASADPISGIGGQLMKKMGWKEGDGLGKDGSGILIPIVSVW
jgi:hypothetical protein